MPLAHYMRTQLGKIALAKLRKALEQFLAGHQRQNRVAQKFQLLVVVDLILALPRLLRLLLSRLRAVGEGLLNHRPAVEVVAQRRFQRSDFPFLHDETTGSSKHSAALAAHSIAHYFGGGVLPLSN